MSLPAIRLFVLTDRGDDRGLVQSDIVEQNLGRSHKAGRLGPPLGLQKHQAASVDEEARFSAAVRQSAPSDKCCFVTYAPPTMLLTDSLFSIDKKHIIVVVGIIIIIILIVVFFVIIQVLVVGQRGFHRCESPQRSLRSCRPIHDCLPLGSRRRLGC